MIRKSIFAAHNKWLLYILSTLAILSCDQSTHPTENVSLPITGSVDYPLLDWRALTPNNWDAMALLKDIDLDTMEDDDPRAFELLKMCENNGIMRQWLVI